MTKLVSVIRNSAVAAKKVFLEGNLLIKTIMVLAAIGGIVWFCSILLDLLKIASLVAVIYIVYYFIKKLKPKAVN